MRFAAVVSLSIFAVHALATPTLMTTNNNALMKRFDADDVRNCQQDCFDNNEDDWQDYIDCCDECSKLFDDPTPGGLCTSSDNDSVSDCLSECESEHDTPDDGIGNDGADCATKCIDDCLGIDNDDGIAKRKH